MRAGGRFRWSKHKVRHNNGLDGLDKCLYGPTA